MTERIRIERVLLVEDRADDLKFVRDIVRDAFAAAEIRMARTLEKAREHLESFRIDLLVVDLHLPDGIGATLIPHARQRDPDVLAVVATVFDDDEHLFSALQHGADGYLLKDESRVTAVEILRDVLEGRPPMSARMARRVLRHVQATAALRTPVPTDLTPRERDVLVLLARGHTVESAASKLEISAHTVKTHVKSLYRKLEVSSRASLVRTALEKGLA